MPLSSSSFALIYVCPLACKFTPSRAHPYTHPLVRALSQARTPVRPLASLSYSPHVSSLSHRHSPSRMHPIACTLVSVYIHICLRVGAYLLTFSPHANMYCPMHISTCVCDCSCLLILCPRLCSHRHRFALTHARHLMLTFLYAPSRGCALLDPDSHRVHIFASRLCPCLASLTFLPTALVLYVSCMYFPLSTQTLPSYSLSRSSLYHTRPRTLFACALLCVPSCTRPFASMRTHTCTGIYIVILPSLSHTPVTLSHAPSGSQPLASMYIRTCLCTGVYVPVFSPSRKACMRPLAITHISTCVCVLTCIVLHAFMPVCLYAPSRM